MFSRILVASDLGPSSKPALQLAARLSASTSAVVLVLHVLEEPDKARHWLVPFFEDELRALRGVMQRQEDAARRELAKQVDVVASERLASVEYAVRWGDPAQTIVDEAAQMRADVIIVGTRGVPLGSVAERVMLTAHRPVLVVPTVDSDRRTAAAPRGA